MPLVPERTRLRTAGPVIAAPALWLVAWAVMRLGGHNGPGAGWTAAHALWLLGFALVPAWIAMLFRLADDGRRSVPVIVAAAVTAAGALAFAGQMAIDLVAGLVAEDGADLDRLSGRVADLPGVHLFCYVLAPPMMLLGLVALATSAAVRGRLSWPVPALLLVGAVLTGIGHSLPGLLRIVEGGGQVCLLVAAGAVVAAAVGAPAATPAGEGVSAGPDAGPARRSPRT